MYATFWALLPPIVAIVLALITKEAYSSLFIGILVGGLFYAGGNIPDMLEHIFNDGMVTVLTDTYNIGILIFLVFLGIMVSLINKSGGSAAFGRWASKHVKTRVGTQLATIVLGILIFIDDYFNCLTVGSVMRPATDRAKISRAKLAYLIDSTAAPICIIAPISSWAAAVSGFAPEGTNGLMLFIKAIPYNYYAILTLVMMVCMVCLKLDYGPMAHHERNAINGDIFSIKSAQYEEEQSSSNKGKVIDLILPIFTLIVSCVICMLYTGGFFSGENFINAFANSNAAKGLMLGSFVALAITMVFYLTRKVIGYKACMESVPEGFKAMVPAILILTLAWTLKSMTDSLGAKEFVAGIVEGSAGNFANFLPAIIFVIAAFLAFATGTSWGTFGILIPITLGVFPIESDNPLSIICISACMAGAVCGDHCSPISDTTIMSSAGAQCDHMIHVSTQIYYAITCAVISFVTYLFVGFVPNTILGLAVGITLTIGTMFVLRKILSSKKISTN